MLTFIAWLFTALAILGALTGLSHIIREGRDRLPPD
jgi:uncharacterized membrane protein YidH (DUF202 family)